MSDNKGFTLIEVLVALFIMSIGFLAVSQMQYLSLRQSQLAHSGTTATNLIQAFSDSDLSRIRYIHILNQNLLNKIEQGAFTGALDPAIKYCNTAPCNGVCPCDPFLAISDLPDVLAPVNSPQHICTAIDIKDFSFDNTLTLKDPSSCDNLSKEFYLVRTVGIAINNNLNPAERTYSIAYSVKNLDQWQKHPLEFGNSLATHYLQINAHVDNLILAGSNVAEINANNLIIPNIP